MNGDGPTNEAVWAALSTIPDPEFGVNIVDLGLVYSVDSVNGEVEVVMTLTTPTCPAGSWIHEGAKKVVAEMPGVKKSQVNLIFDPPWNTEMLTPAGRRQLGWQE